jgi:hypothetical protein
MIRIIRLLTVAALLLVGCEGDLNPIHPGEGDAIIIDGRISNFRGDFDTVYSSISSNSDPRSLSFSDIDSTGHFHLIIPPPTEDQLFKYTPWNFVSVSNGDSSIFIDSIAVADSDMRYARIDLKAVSSSRVRYVLSLNQAKLTTRGDYAKVGDYILSYYYFSSRTLIDGYYKCRVVAGSLSREVITEFHVHTNIGWNLVITRCKSDDLAKSVYEVAEQDIAQGEWLISADGSFSNAVRRL